MPSAEENPCIAALMPAWATGHTKGGLVLGAHLPTRDGRRIGNAHIINIGPGPRGTTKLLFTVLTDAGKRIKLNQREVFELFHSPQWVSDLNDVMTNFSRSVDT